MALITKLASPSEHRASAARAAAAYTALVRANASDAVLATSCQHAADCHRVMAALWSKAAAAMDPETTFFRLASQAMAAAVKVPEPRSGRAADLIVAVRHGWSEALAGLNIPLVFPEIQVPGALGAPDWGLARNRYLHGMSPADYVAARRRQTIELRGASSVLAGVDAYLVDSAVAGGDEALITVYARWARLVSQVGSDTPEDSVVALARDVLGPVESVRASEYLTL